MIIRNEHQLIGMLERMFEMPSHRQVKCRWLFRWAKEARGGYIVELGTYHGTGAIALGWGSKNGWGTPVLTVDDYLEERFGWAGERYCHEDREIFLENILKAGVDDIVRLVEKDAIEAAEGIDHVSLLFWDTGCKSVMQEQMAAWMHRMIPDGLVVLHDTYNNVMGAPETAKLMLESGLYRRVPFDEKGFTLLRRRYE